MSGHEEPLAEQMQKRLTQARLLESQGIELSHWVLGRHQPIAHTTSADDPRQDCPRCQSDWPCDAYLMAEIIADDELPCMTVRAAGYPEGDQ